MTARLSTHRYKGFVAACLVALVATTSSSQTRITPPPNKYSPTQDVELGRDAAAEAKKQLPMLNDDRVDNYVEDIGRVLASAISG